MKNRKTFKNPGSVELSASFRDFLCWQKERLLKKKDLSFTVPCCPAKDAGFLKDNRLKTTISWIGHSSFLIQVCGLNIITDPVWASSMGFAKRMAPPGLLPDELPPVDIILISHNHYDHLDFKSINQMSGSPLFLIPEGLGSSFKKRGKTHFQEFQWWDKKQVGSVEFTFVPAQHWSKRTPWDTNKSLWGGWVISGKPEGVEKNIYFAGDTGYFPGFKEIGTRYRLNFALMPIGAYEPEWFMQIQHVTPEEAVKAFIDTGAQNFIPMHYEAFRLGDDTPEEALKRLSSEWSRCKLEPGRLRILNLGETVKC